LYRREASDVGSLAPSVPDVGSSAPSVPDVGSQSEQVETYQNLIPTLSIIPAAGTLTDT